MARLHSGGTSVSRQLASDLSRVAQRIDNFTTAVGRIVSLLGFATVLVCFATVYLRYALGVGFTWTQELYTWTHVYMIMLGSAYTLLKGGFVRVDMLYARASVRTKALIDLFGSVAFTLPFLFMIAWYGWPFFLASFTMGERSQYEDGLGALYVLKASLMIFAVLVALQVIGGMLRNIAVLLGSDEGQPPGVAS